MRSQLGETFRILGLHGRVVSRAGNCVFGEIDGGGFLCVVAQSEGDCDYVVTMAGPDWVMTPETVPVIEAEVCRLFQLDPSSRMIVRLAEQIRYVSDRAAQPGKRSAGEPYLAEPVYETGFSSATKTRSDLERMADVVRTHLAAEPEEELYCVPRRYDLSSMFALSVAYALLFSIMRALSHPPSLVFLTGIFFAAVGAAQAILFDGKKPREASILAGGVAGFLCVIVFGIVDGDMSAEGTVAAALCSLAWCPIAGYVAGTCIGGIWLVADYLRQRAEAKKELENTTLNGTTANAVGGDPLPHVLDD